MNIDNMAVRHNGERDPYEIRGEYSPTSTSTPIRRHYALKQLENNSFDKSEFQDSLTQYQLQAEEEAIINKYVGIGVSWISLITENLLSHPFIVLRRQCQVNNISKKYHLVPYTLVPVVLHLYQRQGLSVLWKGLGSVLLVRGMTLGVEDLISKLTLWPKEIDKHCTFKKICHHIMLKCVSIAVITPFLSASLVETVQSDIASEKPGLLDVFQEGAIRIMVWSSKNRGRMLPIWMLTFPTIAVTLSRYLFSTILQGVISKFMDIHNRFYKNKQRALSKDISDNSVTLNNVNATFVNLVATDIIFYPCETILNRILLQGTRTIIDNLDNGDSVLPILTNYENAFDCYRKTVNFEGTSGLYKGFGVMILQYSLHYLLIRVSSFLITEFTCMWRSTPKPIQRSSPPVVYPEIP